MSNKFNLSEAAAEILNRSIASAKAGADTASKRLPTSVVPGMKEVGDIGTQVLKTTDGGPDATRGVGSATPPGATPPVGAEPMKKLKGQPAEQGSAEQPEGKAGRQMMAKNPGATFQSYGGQNEEVESDEEETIEEEEKKKNPFDDMMKAAKERQGPQPSGGSGKKMGTRYGGSKQKNEEVEQEIAEAESIIENFDMINEVSLGAKIRAFASHSVDSHDHYDMGNDEEGERHEKRADKILSHIRKNHGDEAATHAERAGHAAIMGRDHPAPGVDKLHGGLRHVLSKDTTKAGKIPKNTADAMKRDIKRRYSGGVLSSRIGGPKGHLPEEVEKDEGHEDEKQDKAMMKKMMSKKNMKEDIDALLQGEELSEEFVQRATTIFEAAVNSRVQEISEQLQEELEGQFVEALEQVKEDFATKIDDYMNYVVEEWMKENELAIESGLRAEIVEDFIGGLHNLFAEHYINIPEEKVDIVEEMAEKVEELEEKLNEEMQKVVEFRKELNEAKKFQAVQAVCEGLTQTQAEKLKSLAESVEFTSEEDFAEKLGTLKEAYIPKSHKTAEKSALEEGVEIEEKTQQKSVDPLINAVVNSISKSVAK